MKTKVKVQDLLGDVITTPKGFIRQCMVLDVTGGKSVIKVFSKKAEMLPSKEGQELVVECNEFCFA